MINLWSAKAKRRYARSIINASIRFEKLFRKVALSALNEEYRFIADRVKNGNLSTTLPNPPSKTFVNKLLQMYIYVGKYYADLVHLTARSALKKDFAQTYIDTRMNYFKSLALNKANEISKTTKKIAIRIIKNGVKEGKSGLEIAKEIYAKTGIESFERADKIARTEVHNMQNVSMFDAAKTDPEVFQTKQWYAVDDDRTRQGHFEVSQLEPIPMDEYFVVNIYDSEGNWIDSDEMLHPGDLTASAANTIYCRCLLLFFSK
ncbi:MAG: phage minor head protein [Methanogenium sp.]|jgi:hypothetical protein